MPSPTPPVLSKYLTKAGWKNLKPKASAMPVALGITEGKYNAITWADFPHKTEGLDYETLKNYSAHLNQQVKKYYEPLKKQLDALKAIAASEAEFYKLGSGKIDKGEARKVSDAATKFEQDFGSYFTGLVNDYKSFLVSVDEARTALKKKADYIRGEIATLNTALENNKLISGLLKQLATMPPGDAKARQLAAVRKTYDNFKAAYAAGLVKYGGSDKARGNIEVAYAKLVAPFGERDDYAEYTSYMSVSIPLNKKALTGFEKNLSLIASEAFELEKGTASKEKLEDALDAALKPLQTGMAGSSGVGSVISSISAGNMEKIFSAGGIKPYIGTTNKANETRKTLKIRVARLRSCLDTIQSTQFATLLKTKMDTAREVLRGAENDLAQLTESVQAAAAFIKTHS